MQQLLKLAFIVGLTAFGGPAAHIAMMHRECVEKKQWLTDSEFSTYMSLCHIIPGPNSTEMMMLLGAHRKGFKGLLVSGIGFILPAAVLTGILTWVYKTYHHVPAISESFKGIQLCVVALIVLAISKLMMKNTRTLETQLSTALAVGVSFYAPNALYSLGVGVVSYTVLLWTKKRLMSIEPLTLLSIFIGCAKIGAVLLGSGYVLIAYIDDIFVKHWQWITHQQLLDLVAIGQITPGPVLTTATALGFLLADTPGAIVATVGIFLPSFIFVSILFRLFKTIQHKDVIVHIIQGLTAGAIGLMIAVSLDIGLSTITSWRLLGVAIFFLGILWQTKLPTPVVIGLAAILGPWL